MSTLLSQTRDPRSEATDITVSSPAPTADRTASARRSPAVTAPLDGGTDRFVLFPVRAFLAFGWLRAGVEKVIDGAWWTGAKLDTFLSDQSGAMLPFMEPLTNSLVAPAPFITAALVLVVELAIGVLLLTGRRLGPALLTASALNVIFVLMGVVTPSAFYLVMQLTLLLALGARTGWFNARRRLAVIGGATLVAIGLAPFIATIHPAEVIHDPAIMLVTVGALAAATQGFTLLATSPLGHQWLRQAVRPQVGRSAAQGR